MSYYGDTHNHIASIDNCIFAGFNGPTGQGKHASVYKDGAQGNRNHPLKSIRSEYFRAESEAVAWLKLEFPDMCAITQNEFKQRLNSTSTSVVSHL